MFKIRISPIGFSKNWTMIGASLLYGAALGLAIVAGKSKTWAFLLLPTVMFIFRIFPERINFWLLAFSIPLSLMQMPSLPLPYGTQVSEAILVFLTLDEILFIRNEHKQSGKPFITVMEFLLGLFALAGLVANIRTNSLNTWNVYCLQPFMIFFLISRKIHNQQDAWLLVKCSLLTIICYIAIVEWSSRTGHFFIFDAINTETFGIRMADGMVVKLGPIRLTIFATRIGAITALGLPTSVLLWMGNRGKLWWNFALLLTMAGLGYVLILSATRGSLVAAIFGTFLAILISGRLRSSKFVGVLAIALIVLAIWGKAILNMLPSYNIQRLLTLSQGVGSIANFHQRMDALIFAWNLTLQKPLGVGFIDTYHTYQVDDAIIYAVILEGTGIIGALAFIMMAGYSTFQIGWRALKSAIGSARDLASVGLGTLATGLLAGISSQSILFEPVQSIVFWTILAVCYCTIVRSLPDLPPRTDVFAGSEPIDQQSQ